MIVRAILFGALTVAANAQTITFYRDVLPIFQARCQQCHRAGQMAPMPLETFAQARPWARSIREKVLSRAMPPWFADPCCGKFEHDRRLSDAEINTLAKWAETGATEGKAQDAPAPPRWNEGWNLPSVDRVISMAQYFHVPAAEPLEYQYFILKTGLTEDTWVRGVELRPTDRAVVHHAVVYVRLKGDTWDRGPTKADILTVYAPGSEADTFPEGMAKLIPVGADLVMEVHYTPKGRESDDRIQVGLMVAAERPAKRVITLQMDSSTFIIPPGAREHRVMVWGTLPNDALLLGFFPHMHLRGKSFEYTLVGDGGRVDTLLRVPNYDFYWQLSYRLAVPRLLKKGSRLNWIATFDNSAANPRNPDPTAEVHYGHQSWDEMMVGFFDVAVDAAISKEAFFIR
jgi:hypothetical protein